MAAKKPSCFTAVSYITEKSGDGKTRCREEIVFEQIPTSKGIYAFQAVSRTAFMPESEQTAYDKRMMRNAGEVLSEYLSRHIK